MPTVKRLLAAGTALIGLTLVVAGLPWLLIAAFGWPGPDHLPSLDELFAVATQPITQRLAVNLVAIAGWATWSWFTVSFAFELSARVRTGVRTRVTTRDPVRWLIAICLTAIAASLAHPAAAHSQAIPTTAAVSASHDVPAPRVTPAAATPEPEVHTVRTGDTLWDIAGQHLHKPAQWTDIYRENKGQPQPGHERLTDPDIIKPGWSLDIPSVHNSGDEESDTKTSPQPGATPKPQPPPTEPDKPSTDPASSASTPAPSSNAPGEPTPAQHASPAPAIGSGVWLAAGTFVSLTAIAGLLAAVRRARKRATNHTTTTRQPSPTVELRGELAAMETIVNTDLGCDLAAPAAIAVGRDGTDIPAHTLTTGGLGLTGPGAHAAARALMTAWLSTGTTTAATHGHVVTTTDTLTSLSASGDVDADRIARLVTAESTTSGITTLMREITTRTRILDSATDTRDAARILTDAGQPPILTILTPDPGQTASLRALLRHGARLGITGIILGEWPDKTITINADGTPPPHHEPTSHIERFYIATPACLTDTLTTLIDIDTTTNDPVAGIHTIHQPASPAAPRPPVIRAPARPTPRPVHTRIPPASDAAARHTEAAPRTAEPQSPSDRASHHRAPTATIALYTDQHKHEAESAAPQQHLVQLLANAPDGLTRVDLIEALYPTTPMIEARHKLHQLIADTNSAGSGSTITYHCGRYRCTDTRQTT